MLKDSKLNCLSEPLLVNKVTAAKRAGTRLEWVIDGSLNKRSCAQTMTRDLPAAGVSNVTGVGFHGNRVHGQVRDEK